jgi:hypothetical protein
LELFKTSNLMSRYRRPRGAGALALAACATLIVSTACAPAVQDPAAAIPRTASGRPNLQGIWQVRNAAAADLLDHPARHEMRAGRSVVEGNEIPYQEWAAAKKLENATNRATADPLSNCYMPGVPRIMYMPHPFHIFQTDDSVGITFEWSQVFRLIYTNGSKPHDGIEFWMGDSRGRWEGDSLVVDVTNHNDKTWFDMAGNFHSEALKLVERYTMTGADTIRYEVTVEDPKVFTRPWKMSMDLHRHTDMDRVLEYQCQAELEEERGDFERDPRTWYPGPGATAAPTNANGEEPAAPAPAALARPAPQAKGEIRRLADGTPDISGHYQPDGGGANYGLETHPQDFLTPGGRGVVVDPPDGQLPMLAWAEAEQKNRMLPERGYDDPTAHCFPAGVPRSMYTPSPVHILQPPGYVVILSERMAWRVIPLDGRRHIPDSIRLWQGDSVGRWDGNSLIVETRNLNGKTWLNEVGEIVSHAETVVERLTPIDADTIQYEATVTDPLVYSRPWTIALPMNRQEDDLLEVACHEDNQDLQHLKDVRDEARRRKR